jgi:hypothetical protein
MQQKIKEYFWMFFLVLETPASKTKSAGPRLLSAVCVVVGGREHDLSIHSFRISVAVHSVYWLRHETYRFSGFVNRFQIAGLYFY